ncbi:MAG: hypothetical protein JWR34_5482 [Mycobacterium sp.]|nr:hypothetical protein [Mycobacterium sp.]
MATTSDWSEGRLEVELLTEVTAAWTPQLRPKVGRTHRLIPPRSMTQLMREVLDQDPVEIATCSIDLAAILELIMSITTEQLGAGHPLDAVANPDPAEVAKALTDAAALTPEQSIAANRQMILEELANLQSNSPIKLELILASTHDLWFTAWPQRVSDDRIGESPAATWEIANSVPLLDVMVVGHILTEGTLGGQYTHTKKELVEGGATVQAVEFVFQNMALDVEAFRRRLKKDRKQGSVADQRYVFTERPFLLRNDGSLFVLRYQWMIDRFFGGQLYWQTFFSLGVPDSGSIAESFSQAMNYAFERVVGDALDQVASRSSKITQVVREEEMQKEWTEMRGETPSVCDFVLPAGRACFLFDATNHHLGAALAQGLATIDDYDIDAESSFVGTKFRQLVSTAQLIRAHKSFGITAEPSFFPFVVVPNNGLSSLATVQVDWRIRAKDAFAVLQGHTKPPVPLTISELALLEGLADLYAPRRDIADLLGGWRMQTFPVSLREFVDALGCAAPIPQRMLEDARTLERCIRERRESTRTSEG